MNSQAITLKVLGDDTILVTLGRVLDNSNAHEMVDTLCEAQADGYKNIIIEMSGLQFLSSAGVGSILGTVEASREAGGDIILCNPAESIRHILTVLDLAEFLTIVSDQAEAHQRCGIGD